MREAIGFAIKWALVATGRTPNPYRGLAFPEGRAFLTPAPGPRLYLRDPTDGRLERCALIGTGPDRAYDADHLSTVGSA